MKKTVFIIMILALLSKVMGFSKEIVLSYFYGASYISDAFLISLTIPGTIFSMIGIGIATSFVPMYSKIIQNEGISSGNKFISNIINILLVVGSSIVFITLIFTENIVNLFAAGFEGETLRLAVYFTRISILGVYFFGVTYIFEEYLRLNNNFILPAIVGVPFNIFLIFSIFLSYKYSLEILAWGNILALAIKLFVLIYFAKKKGYLYYFKLDFHNNHFRKMLLLSTPVILGTSVNQINKIVDRTIASQISEGGISALYYAHRLDSFIQGIFVLSLVSVMYPMISKMVVINNIKGLKKVLSDSIVSINLLVLPATIGSMIFAEPVVRLLFGRGAFDLQAISMTSNALFFYSIGMIGFGLREVLSKVFYSMEDTKTPMVNAAIGMTINIILNLVLSRYLGIGGLALATSLAAIITTMLMFFSLRKSIGPFGLKQIVITSLKIVMASLAMGLIAKYTFNLFSNIMGENLSLFIAIGVGVGVYLSSIYLMKIKEVDLLKESFKKKLSRKGR